MKSHRVGQCKVLCFSAISIHPEDCQHRRKETGGKLGGEWVNQKWVSKNLNEKKKVIDGSSKHPSPPARASQHTLTKSTQPFTQDKSGFDLNLWLKDTVLYFVFLGAFTVTIFAGRRYTFSLVWV